MLRKQGKIEKKDHYEKFSIEIPMVMEEGDERVELLHIPEYELIVQSVVKPLEKEVSIYLRNYFEVNKFPFSDKEKEDIWNHIKFFGPREMRDYNRVFE
ncbi:hypothetical protein P4679_23755 [Priestia megaterium]|uniref:hypothetical protein n=1 Tax=Priestia megaterium TaxID=1404 RepID=UPI002E1C18FE|nr:hypothetical protein [Priestia megaterium]